jgi:hypothetical protein
MSPITRTSEATLIVKGLRGILHGKLRWRYDAERQSLTMVWTLMMVWTQKYKRVDLKVMRATRNQQASHGPILSIWTEPSSWL